MNSVTTVATSKSKPKFTQVSKVSNPAVDAMTPIPQGLTIVSIRAASLLPQVRNAITRLALARSGKLGLPMPPVKAVLSIYSGNVRRLEQAKALAAANMPIKTKARKVRHDFSSCGTRDGFNWCSDEGLCVLQPIIENAEGWVTLEQQISGPVTAPLADGLFRIRSAAQQAGVWVMLFLVCPDGYEKSRLHEFCDEFIEVAPCEPDPGYELAFSIDCVGLRYLNTLGLGKTMCNVKLSKGVFNRTYDQFISSDKKTRVMWILRGHGKTLEEIGGIVNKNKSSVFHRLEGLPVPRYVDMGSDWLKKYLEPSQVFSGTASPARSEDADDDEDDDFGCGPSTTAS